MIDLKEKNENSTPVAHTRSKRKAFMMGFTTGLAISGVSLFGPTLSAVAKDIVSNNNTGASVPTNNGTIPAVPANVPANKNNFTYYLPPTPTTVYLIIQGLWSEDKVPYVIGTSCALLLFAGFKHIRKP
jgi:hypothetical protein